MKLIKKLINDEAGQGLTEYGLVLAGIVLVVATAVGFLTGGINTLFTNIQSRLNSAISATP